MKNLEDKVMKIPEWIGSIYSVLVHTIIFLGCLILILFGYDFNKVLLTLTTIVSLEAIYLSIFIQMSVNRNTKAIASVEKDIDEIQIDMEEITEDVKDIAEDVEDIQENVEEIAEDIEEIQEDVDEITEDIEDIQENVEEITEDIEETEKK